IVTQTRLRGQIMVFVLILIGYWGLITFVPVPANDPTLAGKTPVTISPPRTVTPRFADRYSKTGNLAGYIDRHWLPGKISKPFHEYGSNEGLLSTIPAIATALLGVFAGHWLRTKKSGRDKFLGLAGAGVLCLAAGALWGYQFPIIKNIWTSSFVLLAGGWSLLLLALFYGVIDVLRFRAWSFFFVVIGANAITIYVGQNIIPFKEIAGFFLGGIARHTLAFEAVILAAGVLAFKWLFLLYLYRNKIFLRV
ncbi:MAG: acyltransferase family protein, partial [Burkholderiales bacterium]